MCSLGTSFIGDIIKFNNHMSRREGILEYSMKQLQAHESWESISRKVTKIVYRFNKDTISTFKLDDYDNIGHV